MRKSQTGAEQSISTARGSELSEESSGNLDALYNYPLLGHLLESSDASALMEMRARLMHTTQELERVVRQGTKEDAGRAARIIRAYQATFALLDELEQLRNKSSGAL